MTYTLSFEFLRKRRFQVVTVVFLLQSFTLWTFDRKEMPLTVPALRFFPEEVDSWKLIRETAIDRETLSILKPDDYFVREYYNRTSGQLANLFIAYFRSQRSDRMPHSPRNCLPGNGWMPSGYRTELLQVPGEASPIAVNNYVIRKEDQRAAVLYWYKTWKRSIANEYIARLYLALDSIRYSRTDTALVRIIVPVPDEATPAGYQSAAVDLATAIHPLLASYFPSQ